MTATSLDRARVDEFTSGRLDRSGERALAEQVARLLPYHWTLPNPAAAALSTLTKHLGGQAALFTWLDGHPGRPRLVARTYGLIGLLDRLSDQPAIVTALAETRARTGDPADLQRYLVPVTTSGTLADLAEQIELLLADDPVEDALRVALSTVDLLQRLVPRVGELDPSLTGLGDELEQIRHSLMETSIHDTGDR
jgi:GAF domain-containing protein